MAAQSPNNPSSPKPAPLDGLRVLDFSHALAGPYCTLILSEYGATVYKLESRDGGDMGRGWGPPYYGDQSSFFMGLNRGKYGISVDLKQPEGVELCLRMLESMDVLVENFRPGTMERLGLGFEAVHARNPRLIYCSISGYGQDGPSRDEAAMDLIVQCSSGLLSITGNEGGDPVRCGYSVADVSAGMFAIIGILMALQSRAKTGQGQLIDVSMFDGMISGMSSCFMIYLGSNVCPRADGFQLPDDCAVPCLPVAGSGLRAGRRQRKTLVGLLPGHRSARSGEASRLRDEWFARAAPGSLRGHSVRGLPPASRR